ncbi:MAG: hypothetical protein QXJ15_03305 [Candidatus Bathyarchaeia archaeon]
MDGRDLGITSPEVRGDMICIYDEGYGEALRTLRHEFLDYAISKVIEPLGGYE